MAEIADYINKLVHPIVEIRVRALSSLLQKVQLNLVSSSKLGQHPSLLPNLLQLLKLGPHTQRSLVLELLFFVFKDDSARRQFDSLDGTRCLHSLKAVAPVDLLPDINHLLQKLHHRSSQTSEEPKSRAPVTGQPLVGDVSHQTDNINAQEISDVVDGDQSVESFYDITVHECQVRDREPPVTFTTFPWQALTSSDRRVLDSTVQSLLSCSEGVVVASLHFLNTVVLKDFPAEVLLQRPAIVKAVYGCIAEEGENSWRVQTPGCNCLLTLTQLLNTRVKHFKDLHLSPGNEQQIVTPTSSGIATPSTDITRGSCCSSHSNDMQNTGATGSMWHTKGSNMGCVEDGQDKRGTLNSLAQDVSNTTVHEEDDGDEFILLGMHQLTVTGHCCHIMRVVCPLLVSSRSGIQAASLHLLTTCLTLLQQCVEPSLLWDEENDDDEVAVEVAGEIKRIIKSISQLMLAGFEAKKVAVDHAEAEKYALNIYCLALVLYRMLKDFVPLEASPQVIDGDVSEGLIHVLCDGGFYLEHKDQYSILLQHLRQADPTTGTQIECVLYAAKSLQATSSFLQTSSSQVEQFLDLAEKAVRVSSIHQSTPSVEKLVRGLAKQIAQGNLNEDQLRRARSLILEVFRFPDDTVRLSGYKSVLRLVEDSVGISQVADTSMSRSPRILLLLSPTVIKHILYCGLTDDNEEVVKVAKDILLGLLLSRPLMSAPVWAIAVKCWQVCLKNIQCLAETSTSLGRAVISLPSIVYEDDSTLQNTELLKYHLQCLYVQDRGTRIQALSQVVQRLALDTTTFLPDLQDFQLAVHHDLFIVKQPVHLFLMNDMSSEERRLVKVLELIQGRGVEPGVRKAAWCQLAFLLEDPKLHHPFLQLCSVQYLVMNFVSMLKRDGFLNMTVEFLPGVVETLRLLVTHSADIRASLLQDQEFLLCIVRVALLYYADDHTRYQTSCLMALLVFSDVITFTTIEVQKQVTVGGKKFVAVPELLSCKVFIPFVCDTYSWHEKSGLCREMRTVHQILEEKDWEILNFLKAVWAAAHVGGVEYVDFDGQPSKLSVNLHLRKCEVALLKSSVLKTVMARILNNIENATSHQDVKRNIDTLCFCIQQVQFASCKNEDFLISSTWNQSFQRFLISQPASLVDEQLLIHVLNLLSINLLVFRPILKTGKAVSSPLMLLMLNELQNKDSAILQTLQKSGTVDWVANDPNPQALLSVRLFYAITNLICQTLKFLRCCLSSQDDIEGVSLNKLASCITVSLLPILNTNDELQYYNLAVLGSALECLVHVTAMGCPGEELALQLVSGLIRLISTFHVGRGRAHNSYMGRMITLYSSLALVHLLSYPDVDVIQAVRTCSGGDGILDWSWLVSLWMYRDTSIISTGLNIAVALSTQAHGQSLLHDSLTQVFGGIWGVALRYFLSSGQCCVVRTSAAKLMIRLTRNGPTRDNPWTSPVVADMLTGKLVEGLPALMVLLQHCNFYNVVTSFLAKLYVSQEQPMIDTQPTSQGEFHISVSQLSSFLTSTDDIHNTGGRQNEVISSDRTTSSAISVQLYETVLRLLVNILLLKPSEVILQLFSHDIVTLIVRQLRVIVCYVNTSEFHLKATETALVFIGAVLKYDSGKALSLARDTSLIHLTLVVLSSVIKRTSITIASLEVLNALVCGGGWGVAQVVQWISVSPSQILHPLVAGLHFSASLDLQVTVASFLTNLLHSVSHSEISSQQDLLRTISGALDEPVPLLNEQNVCAGWELSRHLIQLICPLPDSHRADKQTLGKQMTKDLGVTQQYLCLFLDCFKLLLLVSESAKEAAHHLQHFLLPTLTKPFSDLQDKLHTINIHITSQMLKKKEVRDDVQTVIQHLEVATNWVHGRGRWVESVGKSIVPLLHPLWIPALHTPPLLEAVLRFMLTASAHHQVCLFLTRTSGLPGVLLSTSRTKRPLLAFVTTTVCQQLVKLLTLSRSFTISFKDLSKCSFLLAISVLINCARVQACAFVMNKLDLVSYLMKWLACKMAVKEGMAITSSILKLLTVLTTYQESQIAICKLYGWINIIHDLMLEDDLQKDALKIMGNMSQNHHSIQSIVASDDFIKTIIDIIGESEDEPLTELALVNLWALVSNNQRGQALMKQYPFQPLLKHIIETQDGKAASISQKILAILS